MTYLQHDLPIICDPAEHDVGALHAAVGGEAEAHVALRPHLRTRTGLHG